MVDLLREADVSERMDNEGHVHDGFAISYYGNPYRIDLNKLTEGKTVMCYVQTEVTRNLMAARSEKGLTTYYSSSNVVLHDIESDNPQSHLNKTVSLTNLNVIILPVAMVFMVCHVRVFPKKNVRSLNGFIPLVGCAY